jgi:pimeloyl-ACP methyl ester carboxylesterase
MKCDPDSAPDSYRAASPAAHLPLRTPTLLVAGDADADVPPAMVADFHAAAAAAGGAGGEAGAAAVRLLALPAADHYAPLTRGAPAWAAVLAAMLEMRAAARRAAPPPPPAAAGPAPGGR